MADPFDLSGKVALVTGSSRGIGAAILQALASRGARCVVNYVEDSQGRNRADAESLAKTLKDALVVQCDVGDAQQVADMIRQVQQRAGALDILVNNAGILKDRTLKKLTIEEWNEVLRINLTGVFSCISQAAPILRSGGRIVNIASVAAWLGIFGQASYASAKAGVVALTKVAARELAKNGITVNAIAPGVIDTEMTRVLPEGVRQGFLQQIPLARLGSVDDISHAAAFLCSPAAGYITGQVIHVNGGLFMA